jgi:hypothetical protein
VPISEDQQFYSCALVSTCRAIARERRRIVVAPEVAPPS